MAIKQLSLEDVTATLQVPIPGIPGAYGELELSAEGTATIALGAEVPVPFLDDAINGEIQLEIDKEGEIAYGVEINLVGLQLEAMVRGCDIVVNVGYGPLETEAVFPIPDCEPPPEEPLPDPEELESDGEDFTEESFTPPDIPLMDDDKYYLVIVKVVNWTRVDTTKDGATKQEHSFSLKTFLPDVGTEIWESRRKITESPWPPKVLTKSTWPNEPHYESGGKLYWIKYRTTWGGSDWVIDPREENPNILTGEWGYIRGRSTWRRRTVIDAGFGMLLEYYTHDSYRTPFSTLRYDTTRLMMGYDYDRHFYGLGRYLKQELADMGNEIANYTNRSRRNGNTHSTSETVKIIVQEVNKDKKPPLRGEPPMSDCCAKTLKQLAKIRKELKYFKEQFTEDDGMVKEIHTVIAPAEFTEKILPPEYDEDGELIEPGDGAVTLPDVLQELGKKAELELPTDIFEIPDVWQPRSWSDPIGGKFFADKPLPPTKTVPLSFAFQWLHRVLYKLQYALDPDKLNFSSLPARFVKPGAQLGEKVEFYNYPEALKLLYQMIDNYGFHPFVVEMQDTNLSEPGNQGDRKEYLSQGAALQHLITQIEDMNAESNVQLEILVRLLFETGLCHTISADSQQKLQNIQDFLGFEIRKRQMTLKMAFNPLAGESAINAADKSQEEALEEQLPGLLNNTEHPVVVDQFVGTKTLIDFVLELMNAARQKPKGSRWG